MAYCYLPRPKLSSSACYTTTLPNDLPWRKSSSTLSFSRLLLHHRRRRKRRKKKSTRGPKCHQRSFLPLPARLRRRMRRNGLK